MIPLLLYVPPLIGVGRLDVKAVAAITMVQVFAAAVSGVIAHGRHRAINVRLAATGGVAMAAGSLAGAVASHWIPDAWLLVVFALMVSAAFVMMSLPTPPPDVTVPRAAAGRAGAGGGVRRPAKAHPLHGDRAHRRARGVARFVRMMGVRSGPARGFRGRSERGGVWGPCRGPVMEPRSRTATGFP